MNPSIIYKVIKTSDYKEAQLFSSNFFGYLNPDSLIFIIDEPKIKLYLLNLETRKLTLYNKVHILEYVDYEKIVSYNKKRRIMNLQSLGIKVWLIPNFVKLKTIPKTKKFK